MKRVHAENWSTRERLVLASSVLRSGDQNWMSVSRAMRAMADGDRPPDWYSQKQCAVQYEHLLNTLGGTAPPKRKKRSLDASSLAAAADTPQEVIVRKLTQERIEELKAQLVELRASYLREKHEQEEILSGRLDSRLDEIEQTDAERETEINRTKEQASPVKLDPQTAQPESKPTSPLLTSLLQMPSPAMMHRSPTISSLLISSPPVPSPAVTPPRPIAATTLSQLLESPTIAVPGIQKTQSPSRSPATPVPANNPPENVEDELSEKEITEFLTELIPAGVGEQVLTLDNVKDDLIDVKIDDIPLVETDPSAGVTDVDPTEVIVTAENIQTEEIVGKEDTSIISDQTGDTTASAIDDTPDSDLIAETLSELADLDSRTVEMIVVGPNAQLAGGIKEELVEITSTDIDLVTGEAAAVAASMKEIIEGAEVVVEGEAETGGVIEEAVVDSTVIVDNIDVDFGNAIVEETVVEEEVVEKIDDEKMGEEEEKIEEVVAEDDEQQEVVEDEVVVEAGVVEEQLEDEELEEEVVEKESVERVEEVVVERVPEQDEVVVEEAKVDEESVVEEEQIVSIEESVVETTEPTLDPADDTVEKEGECKDEESGDTKEEEEAKPDEGEEVKEIDKELGDEKEEEMSDAEETVEETREKEDVVEKEEEVEEDKDEEDEDEEEVRKEGEVTQADVSSAIAVAVSEMMSSSSTPSTPTSAVLPNILSIASDTVSTSRPETPSTEEDNEPVANLAKKINRRHGGLSGSSSLPNSPLSINALEEKAALNAWKKSIMLVYNRLATHKFASLFLKPITNEQARGYHSVIHRPMDLSTIKKNIEMGNVRTTVEFQRDMMLMFQNAIMYNNQSTLVYQMATQMQAECIQHIQLMVEAMGEGVPLRGDADDMDTSKMTRGRGKVESSQPPVDTTRKRKRSSLPETTTTQAKKKKMQGDEEAKRN